MSQRTKTGPAGIDIGNGRPFYARRGIAPGDYTLFAWETIPNSAYMNAGFMARFEGRVKQ